MQDHCITITPQGHDVWDKPPYVIMLNFVYLSATAEILYRFSYLKLSVRLFGLWPLPSSLLRRFAAAAWCGAVGVPTGCWGPGPGEDSLVIPRGSAKTSTCRPECGHYHM